MAYNFNQCKDKMKQIEEWLKREYGGIRTGQATPVVLDNVTVESYGTRMSISKVANISIEDPKTLKITPWDTSMIKDIEKAITASDIGLSVRIDDSGVRAIFPPLTEERRGMFVKLAKEKLEEAKISVRKERERVLKDLDANEEEGKMSEDEVKRTKNELQKLVDAANKNLEDTKSRKEKEILG
jgi:ribosome recycling factor